MRTPLTALFFLVVTIGYSQDKDKLLLIMEGELNREVTEFTKVSQPPYFIDYRVNDEETAMINSSFGSLTQSFLNHERALKVHVRVGDYLVDNTHPREGRDQREMYAGFGNDFLPLDDHDDAIRVALWRATHAEYKVALSDYNSVKNLMAVKNDEKLPPDFSK
jgi:TldD protein